MLKYIKIVMIYGLYSSLHYTKEPTYSICIEARAAYGLQAVSNKYRCDMLAPRLKTHRIGSLVFSSLLDHQFTGSL